MGVNRGDGDRCLCRARVVRRLASVVPASVVPSVFETQSDDVLTPGEEIKQPYVLESLNLKDGYSETDGDRRLPHGH